MSEFRLEEHVPRQRAAERLADIAYALTAGGTLELRIEGERISVPIADDVLLVRTSTSDGDRVDVAVGLSWSSPRRARIT
jgi:hypothetical protein